MSIRPQHTLVLLAVVSMIFLTNSLRTEDEKKNPRLQNRTSQSNQNTGQSSRYGTQLQRLKQQNQSASSRSQSQTSVRPSTRPTTTPTTSRSRTTTASGSSNNRSVTSSGSSSRPSRITTNTGSSTDRNRRTTTTSGSSSSRSGHTSSITGSSTDRNTRTTTTPSVINRSGRTATMEGSRNSRVTSGRGSSTVLNPGSRSSGGSVGSNPGNRGTSNSGIDRDSRYPSITSGSTNLGGERTGNSSGSYNRGGNSNGSHDSNNRTGRDSRTGHDSNSGTGNNRGGHDDGGRRDHDDDDKDYGRGHDSHGRDGYNDHDRRSSYNRYNSPLRSFGSDYYNNNYYQRYSSRYPSSFSLHTSILLGAAAVSHGSRVLSSERRAESVGYAILFEDGSFRGEALEIYAGESVYNLKDIQLDYSKTFNDRISSLKIYGRLTVVLHTDAAFGGDRIFVHGDMIDFSRISSMRHYNDRISSIEVLQGIVDEHNYAPARGGEYAVYGDPGPAVDYSLGQPNVSYPAPVSPPPIDSARASVPQAVNSGQGNSRVHLFDQPGFRGNQIVLTTGFTEADLAVINKGLAGSWDNSVASIRIEGAAEVFLYTDREYLGQAIVINNSVENLSVENELAPFVGTISSVIVNPAR